jgi:hypothetical protein
MGTHFGTDWNVQVSKEHGYDGGTRLRTIYCSFTGLNGEQSQMMVEKAHVYMTGNGRISMAGLNTHNIRYVAEQIDKVVRGYL